MPVSRFPDFRASRLPLFLRLLVGVVLACVAGLGVRAVEPAKVKATRTVYLVRHGNYEESAETKDGGALTPLGLAQARLVAARLAGMPVQFTALYASTLTRARQTAEVIHASLPSLPVQPTDVLRECTPPSSRPTGSGHEDPAKQAAAEKQLSEAYAKFFVPATGDRDEHDLLVCHGNVIRWLTCRALGVDTKAWLAMSVAHCSITVIQIRADGTTKIFAIGDIGHVPPNLQSGAVAGPAPALVPPR